MLKHVAQEQPKGCGIACIAMLCHIDYWAVFDGLNGVARAKAIHDGEHNGLTRKELCALLEHAATHHKIPLKIIISYLCPRPAGRLTSSDFGIAKLPLKQGRDWHWLVWDGRFIYDPALPFGILPYECLEERGHGVSSIIPMRYAL